jgi:predicted MFS family arabinose efflux permease
VLRSPDALRLVVAGAIGRLPLGMTLLAVVLVVRGSGGSYAVAGAIVAAYSIGSAALSPVVGHRIDRSGQTRLLAALGVAFPLSITALWAVTSSNGSTLLAIALGGIAGALQPPLGACMRVLWPTLVRTPDLLESAFALEATLQEFAFVTGPPLAGLIALLVSPSAALLASGAFGGAGALAFAASAPARRWRGTAVRGEGRHALRPAGVRTVLLAGVTLGASFGAIEVSMPAFAEHHGTRAAGGIVLGLFALGSMLGGLGSASRVSRAAFGRGYLLALGAYALATVPMLLAGSIAVMGVLALIAGVPIAPGFARAYMLLDEHGVTGSETQTFAWNSTSIILGAAVGEGLGGVAIHDLGSQASLDLAVLFAFVSWGTVALRRASVLSTGVP